MRQFRPGVAGGMLAVEVAGGREAGRAIIDALTLTELTASLGSVHTMVVHPPSTSQRQMSDAELADAGHHPGLAADLGRASRTSRTSRTTSRPRWRSHATSTGAVEQPAVGV